MLQIILFFFCINNSSFIPIMRAFSIEHCQVLTGVSVQFEVRDPTHFSPHDGDYRGEGTSALEETSCQDLQLQPGLQRQLLLG